LYGSWLEHFSIVGLQFGKAAVGSMKTFLVYSRECIPVQQYDITQ
jgi:hypothetical protein